MTVRERGRKRKRESFMDKRERALPREGMGGWEGASCHRTATPTATVGPQSSAHPRMVRTVVLGGEKLPRRSRHCEHRVVQGTSHIARFSWRSTLCDVSRRRHGLWGHSTLWVIDKGWVSIQPKTPKGINRDVVFSRLRLFAFNDQKFDRVLDFRTVPRLIKLANDNDIGGFLTARRSHDLGII